MVPGIGRKRQIEVEPESLGEGGATPRDARLHRSDGDVEYVGDLGVVEVGHVAKHDRGPEVVGEVGEGLVENQPIADVIDVMGCALVGELDRVVVVVEPRSPIAFSEFVERGVGGDSIGPGTERRSAIEARKVADDLDERFLARVVGVTTPSGDAPADRVDPVVVETQQLIERVAITALSGGDQRTVVEVCGDARSVTNGSVHDGDLTEASAIRIRVGARRVASEFLEHDEHVTRREGRHR